MTETTLNHLPDEVRNALKTDKLIDIITTGAKSGLPRKTEIWFTNVSGRIILCGTPSAGGEKGPRARRDWLANLKANPSFLFCLKESLTRQLPARAISITDPEDRRYLMSAPETHWYRDQGYSVDELVKGSPIVEVFFEDVADLHNHNHKENTMKSIAFVTGADRGLGLALCAGLLERGWHVNAGQYMPDWSGLDKLSAQYPEQLHIVPLDVGDIASAKAAAQKVATWTGHIDLLINNAGVISRTHEQSVRDGLDYDEAHRVFNINSLGPLRVVQAFLPLLDKGALKRLCFVSSEAGSIARSYRTSWYGYCMSKSALNMGISILFNHLRPEGYTFRVYHPGWIRSYMSGQKNDRADLEPAQAAAYALPIFLDAQEDEDTLQMVDYQGNVWSW